MTRFPGPDRRVASRAWTTAASAIALVAIATSVFAQPTSGEIAESLPRVDVTGFVGWLGQRVANKEDGPYAYTYREWDSRAVLAGSVGYYWTPNIKAELEIGGTTTGRFTTNRIVTVEGQGYPSYVWRDHRVRGTLINGRAVYQFGENAWVHPFVGGGVTLDHRRDRTVTPRQTTLVPAPPGPSRTVVIAEESEVSHSSFDARPQVILGMKGYASERAFLRTDFVWTIESDRGRHVSFRVGAGWDF